jgi:hypothetical protein
MTSTNPIATITNKLGFDVDIYDVFNPNASTQGLLTYTKLATVPTGTAAQQVQTIHFASQLQATRSGNITALSNVNYYKQFPVAVLAVSPFGQSKDFTLTADMQQGTEQSFQFIKYTQANPSSALATNFRTALADKTSQQNAVNTFFQGTTSFKLCTLVTWTTVVGWQVQFTNPWQGTYYLYSLGTTSTGSTNSSSPPTLVATLAIASSAGADSAVLTTAVTNQSTPIVMVGDSSMQEANPGTGSISVALMPTWLNVTQTSQQDGKTVTAYVIGAAFTGTINGVQVAGNLNQLATPSPTDTSQSAADKNAANSFIITTTSQLVGMLSGIGMLAVMIWGHMKSTTQKKNDVQKDAKDEEDAKKKQDEVEEEDRRNDGPEEERKEAEVSAEASNVSSEYKQRDESEQIDVEEEEVAEEAKQVEEVLDDGVVPDNAFEDAAGKIENAELNLENAALPTTSANDREAAVNNADSSLKDSGAELNNDLVEHSNELPEIEANAEANAAKASKAADAEAKAVKEVEEEHEAEEEHDADGNVNEEEEGDAGAEPEVPIVEGGL